MQPPVFVHPAAAVKTLGISPKLVAAVIGAVVTYVLGQQVLELPPVAVLAVQVVGVAVAAWAAGAGRVETIGTGQPVERAD